MTGLTYDIVGLSIAYAALGVLLLTACLFTRFPWPLKAAAIVVTSAFYMVSFNTTRGLLGWSSVDPLPARFKLLHARIIEPHTVAEEPEGAIHLWVEALDDENIPSGVPRAYRLPYDVHLAERAEEAVKASAKSGPQGGRTADLGNGEGGEGQITAREVTPSSITTTAGGDPSSGGPLDPGKAAAHRHTIVFAPLPPPRMPAKDAVR